MNWKELEKNIYYRDGSLRDIYILDFSVDEWRKWVDYVNSNYKVRFLNRQIDTEEERIDFEVVKKSWNDNNEERPTAQFFIDNIQVNVFFFSKKEFDNDIDPKEFSSLADHNKLLNYLAELSDLIGKEVIVTPELSSEYILMKIKDGAVTYYEEGSPGSLR